MSQRLRRLARRTRPPESFALKTVEVDAAHAAEHPDLLVQLSRREVDAVVIRGVLDDTEVRHSVRELDQMRDEAPAEMFGHVLGMPLLRLGNGDQDRTPYYDSTVIARERYRSAFGFDPHLRTTKVLTDMSGAWTVEVPQEDGRDYSGGTVRWYLPGQGGLYPHVGNEFVGENECGALTHLLGVNEVRDWMSWFMVLQRPDVGGTLTVYDLLHSDRSDQMDDPEFRERLFTELASVTFDPAPGDMIVFCGGWRYHRIEEIGGHRARMTYGGFMKPDRSGRALQMWA